MGTIAIPVAGHLAETRERTIEADRLVDRAKKGEQEAFLSLFQTHAPRIYTLSLRLTKNSTAAADNLTQDIFLGAFRCLDAVSDDEAFATLLYRQGATTMIARRAFHVGG
jgi:DNA-directed RNA polymerase specialized sigma24 family protein